MSRVDDSSKAVRSDAELAKMIVRVVQGFDRRSHRPFLQIWLVTDYFYR